MVVYLYTWSTITTTAAVTTVIITVISTSNNNVDGMMIFKKNLIYKTEDFTIFGGDYSF